MPRNESEPVSTLILDCTECVDEALAGEPWRTVDGTREWVADFDTNGEPVHGPDALRCPNCGARGRVWSY